MKKTIKLSKTPESNSVWSSILAIQFGVDILDVQHGRQLLSTLHLQMQNQKNNLNLQNTNISGLCGTATGTNQLSFFQPMILNRIPTVKLKIPGKSIFEIRNQNFCYIQVIVFDLSYLLVAAVGTWQVRQHEKM